jgi:DNA mismatch endonuclease (patch repair protein)
MSRPSASSAGVSARMRKQAERDTSAECALRSVLHAMGLRFRVHHRPLSDLRREADIVFPRQRVAVFVDGCFWHGCREHKTIPRSNNEWWRAKLAENRQRDRDTDKRLKAAGWRSVRVWEHESVADAAERIAALVRGSAPARTVR